MLMKLLEYLLLFKNGNLYKLLRLIIPMQPSKASYAPSP